MEVRFARGLRRLPMCYHQRFRRRGHITILGHRTQLVLRQVLLTLRSLQLLQQRQPILSVFQILPIIAKLWTLVH